MFLGKGFPVTVCRGNFLKILQHTADLTIWMKISFESSHGMKIDALKNAIDNYMAMEIDIINEVENAFTVAPGVWGRKDTFVNFYAITDEKSWVLVDAGLRWSASKIKAMANELFGEGSKPAAIILTHGHFDHVGALPTLLKEWDVPVYAHELELPYLTGQSPYPPADSSVGGGMMSMMAFMYPNSPINISKNIRKLPANGNVPEITGWKFIETPGHSPGHISLYRERDKVLIAGDAFVTTKAESAFYALTSKEHLSGPPKYFTCDWASAKFSVLKLAELKPEIVASGHGKPMAGEEMQEELERLATHFGELAEPKQGRYLNEPAVTNKYGVASWPHREEVVPQAIKIAGLTAIVVTAAILLYTRLTEED
jgi:glyoxylase-like metal-dependent hydrolase (beta-lactamase superfamily II)